MKPYLTAKTNSVTGPRRGATLTAPHDLSLETARDAFVRGLEGKNRGTATIRAYTIDLTQFLTWSHDTNLIVETPTDVTRTDITEYLAYLAKRGLTGVTRARKLAVLREFFAFLVDHGYLTSSPAAGVESPKRERNGRNYLRPDEYTKMLSLAGGNPRDYAILQVFLQTGVRVSELCNLRLSDVDLEGRSLRVRMGKGMVDRDIELEKKGIQAIRSWLAVRPKVTDNHLFLNRDGGALGERGVRKLIATYKTKAGITKKISPHSLRHTFATYKAEHGVSPFQLQQWLGHANLNTTQIYVHLARRNAQKVMEETSLEFE